jgi:diguanylate cyclase (GGDEF)-like protein
MRLTTTSRVEGGIHLLARPRLSSAWAAVVVIGALGLIYGLDRAIDVAPVQHLYYAPILFAGIRFRTRGGITAALAATLLYHLANPHLLTFRYGESDAVQIILFFAVGATTARLTRDADRLHRLAMTDDLTGLHNLRSFEARLAEMVRCSCESETPIALLVLDVDHLKTLNDEYGHLAGAEAVRTVGHIVAARVPPDAVACRYGGDEFVVAVPRCTESRAHSVAEDLRSTVHKAAPTLAGVELPTGTLSVSVGLACRSFVLDAPSGRDDEVGESLFRAADSALYRAKQTGRNHVCEA